MRGGKIVKKKKEKDLEKRRKKKGNDQEPKRRIKNNHHNIKSVNRVSIMSIYINIFFPFLAARLSQL